jgi:hypothetical protein
MAQDDALLNAARAEARAKMQSGEITTQAQYDAFMTSKGLTKPKAAEPAAPKPPADEKPFKAPSVPLVLAPEYRKVLEKQQQSDAARTALLSGLPGIEALAGAGNVAMHPIRAMRGEASSLYKSGGQQFQKEAEAAKETLGDVGYGMRNLAGGMVPMAVPALRATGFLPNVALAAGQGAVRGASQASVSDGNVAEGAMGGAAAEGGSAAALLAALGLAGKGGQLAVNLASKTRRGAYIADKTIDFAKKGYDAAARAVSDRLAGPLAENVRPVLPGIAAALEAAGKFVEPRDIRTISRVAGQELPGSTTGMPSEFVKERAARAAAEAQAAKSAQSAFGQQTEELTGAATARAKSLAKRAKSEAETKADALTKELQAKASAKVGKLSTPTQKVDALQQAIREEQTTLGNPHYTQLQSVGPLDTAPVKLHQQINAEPELRSGFQFATDTQNSRLMTEAAKGVSIFDEIPQVAGQTYVIPVRDASGKIVQQEVSALDLEKMDYMRRYIKNNTGKAGETGISASRARELNSKIDTMEEEFLSEYPEEVRAMLKTARQSYRQKFAELEALHDGMTLMSHTSGAGEPSLLSLNDKDLTELIKRIAGMSKEEKAAFQAGGKTAISNYLQEVSDQGSDAAVRAASKLVGSPAARRRVSLVYGNTVVNELKSVSRQAVEQATGVIAAKGERLADLAVEQGTRQAQQIAQQRGPEAQRLADVLAKRQVTSGRLGDVAKRTQQFEQALGSDVNAPQAFLQTGGATAGGAPQPWAGESRATLRNVGGSIVQREIAGMTPSEALRHLRTLQQNPAAVAIFGRELEQTIARLSGPSNVGTLAKTLGAQLAGRTGGALFGGR